MTTALEKIEHLDQFFDQEIDLKLNPHLGPVHLFIYLYKKYGIGEIESQNGRFSACIKSQKIPDGGEHRQWLCLHPDTSIFMGAITLSYYVVDIEGSLFELFEYTKQGDRDYHFDPIFLITYINQTGTLGFVFPVCTHECDLHGRSYYYEAGIELLTRDLSLMQEVVGEIKRKTR